MTASYLTTFWITWGAARTSRIDPRNTSVDVTELSRNQLAAIRSELLGFVFQSFNLLPRTSAVENVELPLLYAGVGTRERTRRALAALERVGLASRAHHTPGQLSGGQQQRVAIARSLVNTPRVILADEPTGQLDTRTSQELMHLLQDLAATGITIVMVTHEIDIGSGAQRVITMRDGRISEDRVQEPRKAAVSPLAILKVAGRVRLLPRAQGGASRPDRGPPLRVTWRASCT